MSTELLVRSDVVKAEIESIKSTLVGTSLRLGRLLVEVVDNHYYEDYGYGSFGQWLDSSKLDIKERSAQYLIRMVRRQEQLGIPDSVIEEAGFSKAKEILATLSDDEVSPEQVTALLTEAADSTVAQIQDKIGAIKGVESVVLHFKVSREVRDDVIGPALEEIKMRCADDISDSRALELLCAEVISGADCAPTFIDVAAEEML